MRGGELAFTHDGRCREGLYDDREGSHQEYCWRGSDFAHFGGRLAPDAIGSILRHGEVSVLQAYGAEYGYVPDGI